MAEAPPDALSADDAAMLALESPTIAAHTLKLLVLERAGGPLELDALRARVAARVESAPTARRRLRPATGGQDPVRWVEDEDFDIAVHVRAREGTAGLDEAGLARTAGDLMAERLDHRHPLWALDVVGPLADGREAIVARIHHALADGISCLHLLATVLWDAAPVAESTAPGPSAAGARPAPPPARHPRAIEARRLPGALHRELGGRASRSALDRKIGAARELAYAAAPLAELKRIGASRPGHVTVNDVLLAGVAGGLRRWLAAAGRPPRLRAQIPVSLHHRDQGEAAFGNRDSFLNVDLPLAEPDPLARLDRINAETARRKRLGDAQELYDLFHALGRSEHLARAARRLAAGPHAFSLAVSNVPGPTTEISVAGRRVERLCSFAEPADRHALRVSAISCAGTVGIGLCTDPEALPGVSELAEAIDGSLAELRSAAVG